MENASTNSWMITGDGTPIFLGSLHLFSGENTFGKCPNTRCSFGVFHYANEHLVSWSSPSDISHPPRRRVPRHRSHRSSHRTPWARRRSCGSTTRGDTGNGPMVDDGWIGHQTAKTRKKNWSKYVQFMFKRFLDHVFESKFGTSPARVSSWCLLLANRIQEHNALVSNKGQLNPNFWASVSFGNLI